RISSPLKTRKNAKSPPLCWAGKKRTISPSPWSGEKTKLPAHLRQHTMSNTMALQDSTVILSVRCDGNLDVHEEYIEHRASVIICIHLTAHAIWCGTTSSADRVP
ncbi:hypothetical protein T01_1751, partial [Trichinella spiralis]